MEYSDELHDAQVIVPHADWRGSYDRGTTVQGYCLVYGTNGWFVAPPPDSTPTRGDGTRIVGGTYGGSDQHCIDVDWPSAYTFSARQYRRGYDGPDSWMGSMIYESRDASGPRCNPVVFPSIPARFGHPCIRIPVKVQLVLLPISRGCSQAVPSLSPIRRRRRKSLRNVRLNMYGVAIN